MQICELLHYDLCKKIFHQLLPLFLAANLKIPNLVIIAPKTYIMCYIVLHFAKKHQHRSENASFVEKIGSRIWVRAGVKYPTGYSHLGPGRTWTCILSES